VTLSETRVLLLILNQERSVLNGRRRLTKTEWWLLDELDEEADRLVRLLHPPMRLLRSPLRSARLVGVAG
jgi:hypothetical protein